MNALRAYLDTQKRTASKERLMMMLFDAALGHIRTGAELLEGRHKSAAAKPLVRAVEIVALLRSTLDPRQGGDLCRNLTDVYTYVEARLVVAYSGGDPVPAREAERLFAPIVAAFSQAVADVERNSPGGPR
jgi:flagellar secretion chaperone FliS